MQAKTGHKFRFLPVITVAVFTVLSILIAVFLPPKHNPDGSLYYGAALFLSQGRFSDSIQGLYSPLISWLMVPGILAGLSVQGSFRLVNVLVYINFLIGILAVCRRMQLNSLISFLVIFMSALQTLYISSALITSDLLAASTSIWCWYLLLTKNSFRSPGRMIYAGLFGGLSYYAKALQLPIFLATILILSLFLLLTKQEKPRNVFKGSAAAVASCLLLSLFWIIALSLKYHEPIFTAQQLRRKYNPPLHTFSPRLPPEVYFKRHLKKRFKKNPEVKKQYDFFRNLRTALNLERTKRSFEHLTGNASMLYGSSVWSLFLLVVACYGVSIISQPRKNILLSLCLLISFTHIATYMIIWGAYFRYYLPIVPVINILFISGLFFYQQRFFSLISRSRLLRRASVPLLNFFITVIFIAMCKANLLTIMRDWGKTDQKILDYALSLPELKEKTGVITGNFLEVYPPLIAYSLKREFWEAIDPKKKEKPEVLKKRILEWEVSQIIWFSDLYPNLDALDILERLGPFEIKGRKFYIYNVIKQQN